VKTDLPRYKLDTFDLAILNELQRDNTTSQRLIGERVHLSSAAVQRRITRLTNAGVIQGNVAIVSPAAVGRPITVILELELASHQPECLEAAKTRFRAHPAIQQCYLVSGEIDFVAILTVAPMGDYVLFCTEVLDDGVIVKRYRFFVAMDRVKVGLGVGPP
jgi:Lrp/AsnC family leucine-responsive transcriptional regulator